MTKYKNGELYIILVEKLCVDEEQLKEKAHDTALVDRVETSYKDTGLIQPVIFKQNEFGELLLIRGWARLRAAMNLGVKEIPAIFCEGTACEAKVLDNILRKDITHCQMAESLFQAIAYRFPKDQLTHFLKISEDDIGRYLALRNLPDDVFEECLDNDDMTFEALSALASLENKDQARALFQSYREDLARYSGNSEEIERLYGETLKCAECLRENLPLLRVLRQDPEKYSKLMKTLSEIVSAATSPRDFGIRYKNNDGE